MALDSKGGHSVEYKKNDFSVFCGGIGGGEFDASRFSLSTSGAVINDSRD